MKAQPIQAALAAILMTAGIAAAQHPPGPHGVGPYGGPQFPSGLPATPGWPASTSDPFPQLPASVSGVKSAPGVDETRGTSIMPPLRPRYLSEPQPEIPPDRITKPPASLLKQVVADRIRLTDASKPPSKLAGVEVELTQGGYLVTKKYEDYSRVLSDGRPAYLWEITTFVSERDVRVTQPEGTQPDSSRRPADPPPTTKRDPDPQAIKFNEPLAPVTVVIQPRDIAEAKDPAALKHKIEETSKTFQGTVIHDQFSTETIVELEGLMAAAGQAGLETGLTVASVLPVSGTVITTGRAFQEQYQKTYDTLLKNGTSATDAHRQAFLQAATVAGVTAGVDLATGSIASKLKPFIRNPIMDSARRSKLWSEGGLTAVGQATDTATELAAGGLVGVGASLFEPGVQSGPPGSTLPASYGADRNGLYFIVE